MIEYKVKEGQEEIIDLGDKVIVKTGGEIEFSLRNVENDIIYLQKSKKELEAKRGIELATMKNITSTHPHIAEMSQEDLTAAFLYRQATGYINITEEKIQEIDNQLKEYAAEKVEIEKQTGLKSEVEIIINQSKKTMNEENKNTDTPEVPVEAAPVDTAPVTE